jgi:hypothetical protein
MAPTGWHRARAPRYCGWKGARSALFSALCERAAAERPPAGRKAIAYERAGVFDGRAGITGALFNVRSADECAMADILVFGICARRLLAAGDNFLWGVDMTRRCVSTRPDVSVFPLFCALFFSLFSIVSAPAAFLLLS